MVDAIDVPLAQEEYKDVLYLETRKFILYKSKPLPIMHKILFAIKIFISYGKYEPCESTLRIYSPMFSIDKFATYFTTHMPYNR